MNSALRNIGKRIISSLQAKNIRIHNAIQNSDAFARRQHFPLLFGPLTSGGLLAALPAQNSAGCKTELQRLGYDDAAAMGEAIAASAQLESITLTDEKYP